MSNLRRNLVDLTTQRTARLEAAQAALDAGNQADYDSAMADVRNFNGRIQSIQDFIAEQDRQIMAAPAPSGAEARDMAEERGHALMTGKPVTFTADETRRAVMNSITLATGTLVEPTGAGSNIRDPLGNVVSSIVDQVYVQNLTGMGSFLEPYVISEIDAKGGKVSTNAGKARATSTDPTFGVAKISPYELNVTQFVDRNISRLSPADYYGKIYNMAMRAMRRKLAELIVNGDGQATPDMFGIKTAKNVAGRLFTPTTTSRQLMMSFWMSCFFPTAPARQSAQTQDCFSIRRISRLSASCVIRRHSVSLRSMRRRAIPTPVPLRTAATSYTIVSDLTALSTATVGSNPIQTMLYGDPANYELGLFGDYTVRVDDSVKAVERMVTILGDAMVGGNLIVDKGFVIANLPKSGG